MQAIIDGLKNVGGLSADSLKRLSNKDLIRIASFFDAKKTGTKKELIHQIKETIEDADKKHIINIDEQMTTFNPVEIQNYIASSGMNVLLAMVIIKSIAKNGYNPVTGKVVNDCWLSCFNLYLNHYKENIFDDICQNVYVTLHNMAKYHEISIQHGYIVFYPVLTMQGEIISNITKAFKAVRACLASYKNTDTQRAKQGYYTITYDNDGTERLIGENSTNYIVQTAKIADINDCLDKQYMIDFINYIKDKYPKQFDVAIKVLTCQIDGLTEIETAEKLSLSRRTVQRYKEFYRTVYADWKNKQPEKNNTDKRTKHDTYRKSDVSCSGSYTFTYGDIRPYVESGRKPHGFCFSDSIARNKDYDKAKKALSNSRKDYTGENVHIFRVKGGIITSMHGQTKHFIPYAK